MKLKAVTLILSDARGIYIPCDFLCDTRLDGGDDAIAWDHCAAWGLTKGNLSHWVAATLPESNDYWDAWDWVLDNARFVDDEGNVYTLHQDGDLWGLCTVRMSAEELENFGFEE